MRKPVCWRSRVAAPTPRLVDPPAGPDRAGREIPFDRTQQRLLPIADIVMVAMVSRPPSGTLRTTKVTTATNVLAVAAVLGVVALAIVLAVRTAQGHGAVWLALEVPLAIAAVGFGDLAAYGLRQGMLMRAAAR